MRKKPRIVVALGGWELTRKGMREISGVRDRGLGHIGTCFAKTCRMHKICILLCKFYAKKYKQILNYDM